MKLDIGILLSLLAVTCVQCAGDGGSYNHNGRSRGLSKRSRFTPAPTTQSTQDGGWSFWLAWTACSRTCGDGIHTRSRSCDNPLPSIQGQYCLGDPYQVETCNTKSCPVTNGGWGLWTTWTSCTTTCGVGIQSRQRHCNSPKPSAGGDFCDGSASDVRLCRQQQCPVTNGGWGSWTTWTSCTASYSGGMQTRQRYCNNPKPSAGGDFCDGSASDVRLCNQQLSPRNKVSFSVGGATKGEDKILRFSTVFLNEGSAYDTVTGVFTCPYPGQYVFIATIIESGSGTNHIDCRLRRNGYSYVDMYSSQGLVNGQHVVDGYGAVTGATAVHLEKGDRVFIYCLRKTESGLSHSSFTGFLLNTDP